MQDLQLIGSINVARPLTSGFLKQDGSSLNTNGLLPLNKFKHVLNKAAIKISFTESVLKIFKQTNKQTNVGQQLILSHYHEMNARKKDTEGRR